MGYINKSYLKTQFDNFANKVSSVFAKKTEVSECAKTGVVSNVWQSNLIYGVGSYCIYNNVLWKCLVQNTNQVPGEGTYWHQTNTTEEISALNSNLSNKQNKLSAKNFTIPISIDTSSLSSAKINIARCYGNVVHVCGEVSIKAAGTWKKIGNIPSEYATKTQFYVPLFRFGATSKNTLYILSDGTFGVNSIETGDAYFFDFIYIY